MATLRDIRHRIRSVKSISQVTRAMQMVAAAKMRRAQDQALATRPYAERAWRLLLHLAGQRRPGETLHPLLQTRPVRAEALLLITSDKGLCGGYNHNIVDAACDYIERSPHPVRLVVVGRRGAEAMHRAGHNIVAEFCDLPARPTLEDTTAITRVLRTEFEEGQVDRVALAYTVFVNTLVHRPVVRRLLPLEYAPLRDDNPSPEAATTDPPPPEYIYEPDPATILATVIPSFTEIQVYQAILEAMASEHSARMVAMRNATENAEQLIEDLTMAYHRVRQATITREMLDIAGGAEALRQAQAR